jgi:hypothetical protein
MAEIYCPPRVLLVQPLADDFPRERFVNLLVDGLTQ